MMTIEDFERIYEPFMCGNVNTMIDYLKDGDVFVDIGANTGLVASKIYEKTNLDKLILIEPIKPYYEECVRKFESKENVEIVNIGFSDENGTKKILCSENNLGYNKIEKDGMEIHPHFVQEVECVKFSDWVGDRKVNFIKIDAEGHDTNIVKGMFEWLDNVEKKPYILFEGEWYSDLEDEMSSILSSVYSYDVIRLGRDIFAKPKS
jgi:FkbM family methyltransferase